MTMLVSASKAESGQASTECPPSSQFEQMALGQTARLCPDCPQSVHFTWLPALVAEEEENGGNFDDEEEFSLGDLDDDE